MSRMHAPVFTAARLQAAIAVAAMLYVLLRALFVPPIHDECASLIWFVQPGEWLPWEAHWDANNHYLSTGIGILLHRMLGDGIVAVRLGSMVAFAAYLLAGGRLAADLGSARLRLFFMAAWSWCPFVLDLFALFRGYGIALAAWSWALVHVVTLQRTGSVSALLAVLLCTLVANTAIVALIPPWAVLIALLPVFLAGRSAERGTWTRRHWLVWLMVGLVPLAAAARLALELQHRGLLYHGRTDGLMSVTVASLARLVFGSDAIGVLIAVVLVAACVVVMVVADLRRTRTWATLEALLVLLMALDLAGRVVMASGFGVNFPEDRAAVHLLPVALLLFARATQVAAAQRPALRHAGMLLLLFPLISMLDLNVDHTRLWPEQSIPRRFVERIAASEDEGQLVVGGHHQLALCWSVLAAEAGCTAQLQSEGFPAGTHEWRIVDGRFIEAAMEGYRVADRAHGPGLWLLEREHPVQRERVLEQVVPATEGAGEFVELMNLPDTLQHIGELRIGVNMACVASPLTPELSLVWEVNAADGGKLRYVSRQVSTLLVGGDSLTYELVHEPLPTSRRAVLYLHNPRHAGLRTAPGVVHVDRMVE